MPKATEITVIEGDVHWNAFIGGEQLMQEFGASLTEAVGKLVMLHPERFGVSLAVKPNTDRPQAAKH